MLSEKMNKIRVQSVGELHPFLMGWLNCAQRVVGAGDKTLTGRILCLGTAVIIMRLVAGRPDRQLDHFIIAHIIAVFIIVTVAVDEIKLVVFIIEIPNLVRIIVMEAALGADPQAVIVANHIVIAAAGERLTHSVIRFVPTPDNVILDMFIHPFRGPNDFCRWRC